MAATDAVRSDLLLREADMVLRMTVAAQQALIARRPGKVTLELFAYRDYPERHGTSASIVDLNAHDLIGTNAHAPGIEADARMGGTKASIYASNLPSRCRAQGRNGERRR